MKTFGTTNSDYGTACIQTEDCGSLLLTGGGASNSANVQFGVVKTGYDGTLEWQKVFQFGSFSTAVDAVLSDNGYCIVGSTGGSFNSQELFVMQLDVSGNEVWKYHYNFATNGLPVQLVKCQNGDLLCLAVSSYNSGSYPAALIMRMNASGDVIWTRTYSGFNGVSPKALVELSDGSLVFTCAVRLDNQTYPEHVAVTKTDASGIPIWSKVFTTDYLEEPRDMITNANDELFIVGQTYFIENEWDGFFMKLNSEGDLQFDVHYDAGTFQGEIFRDIILDNAGNALVLGDAGGFNERNISILSLQQLNGARNWSYKYPLSPMFTNYPSDMCLSFNNGIVFTGDVRPPGYFRDAALFRSDAQGIIACYTEPINFDTQSYVFEVSDTTIASFDFGEVARGTFTFDFPFDPITEKVVCSEMEPFSFVSHTIGGTCPKICVDFISEELGNVDNWNWEFEGATPSYSSVQNPEDICYPQGGQYKVVLTVSNTEGSSEIEHWVTIPQLDCPLGEIPNVFTPNGDQVKHGFLQLDR